MSKANTDPKKGPIAFAAAPMLRVHLNLGAGVDVLTGRYYKGKHGEMICNGGLANFTAICGEPNLGKTALSIFLELKALYRYAKATLNVYDTEQTLTMDRFEINWLNITKQLFDDVLMDGRFSITDSSIYFGNEWFNILKAMSTQREKDKSIVNTTPFYNHRTKQHVMSMDPMLQFTDSLSSFSTDAVEDSYNKGEIGDSSMNTIALRAGMQKSQMIDQMPTVCGKGGIYHNMTAHIGQDYVQSIDKYAGSSRKLHYIPNGKKLKKVPENFLFYPGWIINVRSSTPLLDSNKQPEYPRDSDDNQTRDTDLMMMDTVMIRNKGGQTGITMRFVLSQSEGIKEGLSALEYLKDNGYYGLLSNSHTSAKGAQRYYCELLPDLQLTRRSVRGLIDNNPKLERALEFCRELHQLRYVRHEYRHLGVDPGELYKKLTEMGYDWDLLLDTRGWWVPLGEEEGLQPFLSTFDLLNIYHGEYHPYWYPVSKADLGKVPVKKEETS